jgi:MinD-like ATPase involved in chromosome partitioning or flagellar assembly
MLTVCWSPKGGSGTTVVTCAMALLASRQCESSLLVDLAGDVPAAFGIAPTEGPGVHDWVGSSSAPASALDAIGIAVTDRLRMVAAGTIPAPAEHHRWALLGDHLADADGDVFVDAGTGPPPMGLFDAATQTIMVIRNCYLAVRGAVVAGIRPSGIVVVSEPGRALRSRDIETAVGAPVVAEVPQDPAVAKAVDSGLLGVRLPRTLAGLRGVVA